MTGRVRHIHLHGTFDAFNESQHPRGKGGQFGSGAKSEHGAKAAEHKTKSDQHYEAMHAARKRGDLKGEREHGAKWREHKKLHEQHSIKAREEHVPTGKGGTVAMSKLNKVTKGLLGR